MHKLKKCMSLLLTMAVFAGSCFHSAAAEQLNENTLAEEITGSVEDGAEEVLEDEADLPTRDSIKIGTFNIAGGTHPDIDQMVEVMDANGIDFAGLQEVDVYTTRNPYDMLDAFCKTVYPYSSYQKAMDYAGGYYGIGIISKQEILATDGGNLETTGSQEPRAWQKVVVEVDGEEIALYNTHLTVTSAATTKNQIKQLISIMDEDPTEYKIITGDFNISTDKEIIYPFLENYNISNGKDGVWYESYTGTSNLANRAIDNVITTRNIKVNDIQMVDTTTLSDHNLFYIDIELLDEEVASDEYLKLLIEKSGTIDTSIYTDESYQAVTDALELAEELSEDATQEEINVVVNALRDAMDSLVVANVALGKTVTSAKGKAERITDGNLSNYWDGGSYPASFVIDLEEVYQISKMISYPYVGGSRYYNYEIYVSTDGEDYTKVAEKTDTTPETTSGKTFEFDETVDARYVKVVMTYNSANGAVHMKEFQVIGKLKAAEPNVVDKEELEVMIQEAELIDLTGYTEESAAAVVAALEDAKAVLEQENADQETVDAALAALADAIDALEELVFEITKQPEDVTAAKGADAAVTVEATGKDLIYTWYYKNPGTSRFYASDSTFADGNTYSIPMNVWRDGQQVYCKITDADGNTLVSDTVTLSLAKAAVTITKQPEDVVIETAGDTAVVTVEADGEDLTYTWFYKNPGNVKFYVSGSAFADENTYSIPVNTWRDGQQVYCVITDASGNTVQTDIVTLRIAK